MNIIFLPLAILIVYIFSLGIVMASAVGAVYFRDLTHIIDIVISILTYALPIIYRIDQVPKQYHYVFYANPCFYLIDMFRKIFLSNTLLSPMDIFTPLLIAVVAFCLGLWVVKCKANDLVFRL